MSKPKIVRLKVSSFEVIVGGINEELILHLDEEFAGTLLMAPLPFKALVPSGQGRVLAAKLGLKPPVAPAFDSDADEARFWDEHSVLDFEHDDLHAFVAERAPSDSSRPTAPARRSSSTKSLRARPHKHGRGWRIQWLANGRRRSATFATRKAAEDALRRIAKGIEIKKIQEATRQK